MVVIFALAQTRRLWRALHETDREKVLAKSWQYVGRVSCLILAITW